MVDFIVLSLDRGFLGTLHMGNRQLRFQDFILGQGLPAF